MTIQESRLQPKKSTNTKQQNDPNSYNTRAPQLAHDKTEIIETRVTTQHSNSC